MWPQHAIPLSLSADTAELLTFHQWPAQSINSRHYLNRNAPRTRFPLARYTAKLCRSWTFPPALGRASVWLNKQHGAQKYIFLGIPYPNILNLQVVLLLFVVPRAAFMLRAGSTRSLPHAKHFMLTSKDGIQTHITQICTNCCRVR